MDDGTHQSENSTGALETFQRGPLLVEGVEQLRVNRVSPSDSVLVGAVSSLPGELVGELAVHLDIGASRGTDGGQCGSVGELEEALLDDVIGLVRRVRAPLVGDSTHDVLKPLQRLKPVLTANLFCRTYSNLVVGISRLGGRDRDCQQDTIAALDGLGQFGVIRVRRASTLAENQLVPYSSI